MVVPNRLRDQVRPAQDQAADGRPWAARRIVATTAVAELVIIAICGLLAAIESAAGLAVAGWIAANVLVGLRLSLIGGGRRAWGPAAVGIVVAGLVAGLAGVVLTLIGVLPQAADASGISALVAVLLLIPLVVFMFGGPVLLLGAVIGSALVDVGIERRHRAVARGDIDLVVPSANLESRSAATGPLDEVGVAKATKDGAATLIVREYAFDPDTDRVLELDAARLASIGYALDGVVRDPPKTGLRWLLLSLGALLLDVVYFFSQVTWSANAAVERAIQGRVVATFRLVSRTHSPVQPVGTTETATTPASAPREPSG